jgi:hypothetical protein
VQLDKLGDIHIMSNPGTRGSRDNELNFVDIILAVGIAPIATFLKGRKTALGAIAALLAYATPLRDMAAGSQFEQGLNLLVAVLEFASVWLGGGGAISWLLAARRAGKTLIR